MAPPFRIWGFVAVLAASLICPAFAQTPTSSSTSGNTTNGSRTPTPGTASTTPGSLSTNTALPPLHLTGRVMVDDGTPPGFPATIERVCGGNPYTEGYTDGKGYFSVTLGAAPDVIQDASEAPGSGQSSLGSLPGMSSGGAGTSGGQGRSLGTDARLANCELRARLGGYSSKSINLSGRSSLDNPDVGTILLHRMGASETATTVTATTLKAPKEARKALQKGLDLEKKNKPEEAIDSLREAVKIDPNFAFAWFELGKLQVENEHVPDGHESFEQAAKAEPRWPDPFLQLALMGVQAHDWREVADTTAHVVALNSYEYPQAYFLNGAANFNLHHIDTAEKSLVSAEKLDVLHAFPQIHQLLGIIYGGTRRFAESAQELRTYITMAPDAEDAPAARQRLAVVERMAAANPQPQPKNEPK